MKKALKILGIVLLSIVVLLVTTLGTVLSPGCLNRIATTLASDFIDGQIKLGTIELKILRSFPNLELSIEDLTIEYSHDRFAKFDGFHSKKAGYGGESDTLVLVKDLSLNLNCMRLLNDGEVCVNNASIHSARFFIHAFDSLTTNLDILNFPEGDDEDGGDMLRFNIESLDLEDVIAYYSSSDEEYILNLKDIVAQGSNNHLKLSMDAVGTVSNEYWDSVDIPLSLDTDLNYFISDDGIKLNLHTLSSELMEIPVFASGKADIGQDSTYVKGNISIDRFPLGSILDNYGYLLSPSMNDIRTDAVLNMSLTVDGWIDPAKERWPGMILEMDIPDSYIAYNELFDNGHLALKLKADSTTDKYVQLEVDNLGLDFKGFDFKLKGDASNVLGKDPIINLSAKANAQLAELVKYIPEDTGMEANGAIDLFIDWKFKLSDLSNDDVNFQSLDGRLTSPGISISSPSDTLYATIKHPHISVSSRLDKISIDFGVDSANFISGPILYVVGEKIGFSASSSGKIDKSTSRLADLNVNLLINSLNMRGSDSLTISIRDSYNKLNYKDSDFSFADNSRLALVKSGDNKVTLSGLNLGFDTNKARTPRNSHRRGQKRRDETDIPAILDTSSRSVSEIISDIDFTDSDISLDLGQEIKDFLHLWHPSATIFLSRGIVSTPLLPLNNTISNLEGSVDMDQIELKNLDIKSGHSDLSVSGRMYGFNRKGSDNNSAMLNSAIDIRALKIDANELLGSLNEGMSTTQDEVDVQSENQAASALVVVPANINSNINIRIDSLDFASFNFHDLRSRIRSRNRCVQITNTSIKSAYGRASLDGFYQTANKRDISGGFNLELHDITANRIIDLVPSIDSLVPLLESFHGLLNCQLTATSQLDTNMNIVIPSLNGVVRVSGSDLRLSENEVINKVGKLLRFKQSNVWNIDDMSIEGIISNNTLEIFPFYMGVDRYYLGVSGTQEFDQSFKYHISVIESPLPFKFGINLKGNFDKWNYTLGRARYSKNKMPVYSSIVDTLQVNLVTSIKDIFRKGTDAAISEYHNRQQSISNRREDNTDDDSPLSQEEANRLDEYWIDYEYEEESKEIEDELNAMMNEDLQELISKLH